jgi:magnesium chelatase subunit H
MPLEELGRPRIDVVMTLSGIFRDLLPLQTRMLAEAAFLAADRRRAPGAELRAQAHPRQDRGRGLRPRDRGAARLQQRRRRLRLQRQPPGRQQPLGDEDELADAYTSRKCFAYGRDGKAVKQTSCSATCWATVDLAYQNLDSVELGVTTVDHYFDTLGGISRAVKPARKGEGGAGLHRRPDPGERQGAHPVRAGRPGDPHPHAQSQVV